ncbi:hypothetical protein MP228_008761 [Amoeboaphelidium protococcarum]|nr:hypothetical protein MP228_008761 [Amoeboaphelidium protococcarum]
MSTLYNIYPLAYQEQYLEKQTRKEGRSVDEYRKISILKDQISTCDSSALIRAGKTTMICGLQVHVFKPSIEEPDKGRLIINYQASPSIQYRQNYSKNQINDEQSSVAVQIYDQIVRNGALSLSDLCIISGKYAFAILLDITCLNAGGSEVDIALIGALSCLLNLTLPRLSINDDGLLQYQQSVDQNAAQYRLELKSLPVQSTFHLVDGGYVLADSLTEEQDISRSSVTITVDAMTSTVLSIHKENHFLMDQSKLSQCVKLGINRAQSIRNQLHQ